MRFTFKLLSIVLLGFASQTLVELVRIQSAWPTDHGQPLRCYDATSILAANAEQRKHCLGLTLWLSGVLFGY